MMSKGAVGDFDELKLVAWSSLLQRSQNLYFLQDVHGMYVDASLSYAKLRGFEASDGIIGKIDDDIASQSEALKRLRKGIGRALKNGTTVHFHSLRLTGQTGKPRYFSSDIVPIRSSDGSIVGIFGILIDITSQELVQRKLDVLSRTVDQDPMTNVLNHKVTLQTIDACLASAIPDETNALFMIDIDDFKQVNDTLGHQMGDAVIGDFVHSITSVFRSRDVIGRVGGDEFLVLMRCVRSQEDVRHKAHELIKELRCSCQTATESIDVTGSVGVAISVGNDESFESLYARADSQLYQAKIAGKNQCSIDVKADEQPGGSTFITASSDGKVSTVIRLQTLLEDLAGFMLICEVADAIRFIYATPTASTCMCDIVDPKAGDERGTVLDWVIPDDQERIEWDIRSVAEDGGRIDDTYRIRLGQGTGFVMHRVFETEIRSDIEGIHHVMLIVEGID